MNNSIIQLKVKQRLNKLDSKDFDNIECWQIVEAFNKGMTDWCRRNLHGSNIKQEGDEQSTQRIDDLEILLEEVPIVMINRQLFWEASLPQDYMRWKRIAVNATSDCCDDPKRMVVYLVEEGNIDELLRDKNKQPNFEWGETFATLKSGKVRVYTDSKFSVGSASFSYYRQPTKIQIAGCIDPYTQQASTTDVLCEFKDDLIEEFIGEAAKIIAGDIEAMNQVNRANQSVESNN